MTTEHPIIPPPEMVRQWRDKWLDDECTDFSMLIATQAARWGWKQRDASVPEELQKARDAELKACCEWLAQETPLPYIAALRAAMRPKPPSLAVKALIEFESHQCAMETNGCDTDLLRAALERLQQLEQENNDN